MQILQDPNISTAFRADGLGDTKPKVLIGGKGAKFVPNVNMSFECGSGAEQYFLNINRKALVVGSETSSFSDKLSLSAGGENHLWHIDGQGRFKWDMRFDSRPATNVFEWEIKCSAGLQFWRQGELDAEEIKIGAARPDEAIGSYAVYCGRRDNGYLTGKLCHIYRPLCIDAKGVKTWADLLIENGKLQITIPQDYLDKATYPVTLDPTLGYTTAGASTWGNGGDTARANTRTTDASGGNISKFHVAIAAIDGTPANRCVKMAVYATSGGSPASQALKEQIELTGLAVSDDNNANAAGSTALAANTAYCIAVIDKSTGNTLKYDNGISGYDEYMLDGLTYASQFPTPASASWTYNTTRAWSIWIDYAPGGTTYNLSGTSALVSSTPTPALNLLKALSGAASLATASANTALLLLKALSGTAAGDASTSTPALSILRLLAGAISMDTATPAPALGLLKSLTGTSGLDAQTSSAALFLLKALSGTAALDSASSQASLPLLKALSGISAIDGAVSQPEVLLAKALSGASALQTATSNPVLAIAGVIEFLGTAAIQSATPDISLPISRPLGGSATLDTQTQAAVLNLLKQLEGAAALDTSSSPPLLNILRELAGSAGTASTTSLAILTLIALVIVCPRLFAVPGETRICAVPGETRINAVRGENRICMVPKEKTEG